MTVTVMGSKEPAKVDEMPAVASGQAVEEQEKQTPYISTTNMHDSPRVHSYSRKRENLGGIVFVQLILSSLLAFGLWAGNVFGSGDIKELCRYISELFR